MVTLTMQISEVEREIAMRRQVYPSLVGKGKMRQAEADHKIAIMTAVRDTLTKLHGVTVTDQNGQQVNLKLGRHE